MTPGRTGAIRLEDVLPLSLVQRNGCGRRLAIAASRQNGVRGALDEQRSLSAWHVIPRGHQSGGRIERLLETPRPVPPQALHVDPRLDGGREKSGLGRITDQPGIGISFDPRIVDQCRDLEQMAARWRRPGRAGLGDQAVDSESNHRHPVFGHRAGLVGTDHRRRAERLDGVQPSYQAVGTSEPPDARGERHRRHRGQSFGNGGHRETDGRLQHQAEGLTVEDPQPCHHGADPQRNTDESPSQRLDLLLEGGDTLARRRHGQADTSERGGRAGRGDEGTPGPRHHRGPQIHHGDSVGQRRIGLHGIGRPLCHRHALSSECGLAHLEGCTSDQSTIGGDVATRLQNDDVSRDDV